MAENNAQQVKVVDSIDTPTLFADGIRGMQVRDGVAIINITQHVFPAPGSDPDGEFDKTVLRLALPIPAFVRYTDYFKNTLQKLIDDGVLTIDAGEKKDGDISSG